MRKFKCKLGDVHFSVGEDKFFPTPLKKICATVLFLHRGAYFEQSFALFSPKKKTH